MQNEPLDDLSKIQEVPPSESQSLAAGKREERQFQNQLVAEQLASLIQDRLERKIYAQKVFRLVCWWVGGVFCMLLLQGFLSEKIQIGQFNLVFKLPDGVLLAVVGGTTASVIGIFVVVANYLFPKR